MEYIDTYHFLNPHLHTEPSPTLTDLNNKYTITRKAVNILRCKNEVIGSAMKIYKFSSQMFETHQVHFVKHAVKIIERNPEGAEIIINAYLKWSCGYFHFLTEVLPSVLEIGKPYTIHTMESKFAQPILQWFGLTNPICFDKPSFIHVKESVEQQYVECGNPSPQKVALIRNIVEKKIAFTRTKGILIYRRESVRQILNDADVLAMLKRVFPAVEWVVFDVLPFHETVELFASAAIIVAPHGAGLTNMLFSDSGVRIIEFISPKKPNMCYWHLSELLNNQYFMIPCKTYRENFMIDVQEVEALLVAIHNE